EFIANGKRRSFTFGSAGVGTGPHIGAEYFFREVAKVQALHVPFTGGAPAVTAAIGNHVDAIVLTLPTVVPPITQGLLRGIGLASAARNSAVPNVPTYGERSIRAHGSASSRRRRRPMRWWRSSTRRSMRSCGSRRRRKS